MFNAARALRAAGKVEASWTADIVMPGEIGRRAPALWLRINPDSAAIPHAPGWSGVFTQPPKTESKAGPGEGSNSR